MTDTDWKQNGCSLGSVDCGIEVQTEGRAITRVRGDKTHPHSAGYICPMGAASHVLRQPRRPVDLAAAPPG